MPGIYSKILEILNVTWCFLRKFLGINLGIFGEKAKTCFFRDQHHIKENFVDVEKILGAAKPKDTK